MISTEFKKTTQALRYLISKSDEDKLNVLLLMKLIWAADRYHLRNYASTIGGYDYRAMPHGPVNSTALDIANATDFLSDEQKEYGKKFVIRNGEDIYGLLSAEEDYLAETNIEALNFAWNKLGSLDPFEVRDTTHEYPEWKKYKDFFRTGSSSLTMDILDFFKNPDNDTIFSEDIEKLENAEKVFEENKALRKLINR